MSESLLLGLRSVDLGVPDLPGIAEFFVTTWGLIAQEGAGPNSVVLRGTGEDHHLVVLHAAKQAELRSVTFRAVSRDALTEIAEGCVKHGGVLLQAPTKEQGPGGGFSVVIQDPQGRVIRAVVNDERVSAIPGEKDKPIRLAHAVLNSVDVAAAVAFHEAVFGMRLSDRTRIMAFVRVPKKPLGDHHSIAFADADNNCLNHVAFVMPNLESVMRGGGRMKDAGFPIEWGPGRHGPGDNSFNYFVGPAGVVIEYTADVSQVDDSYKVGYPSDWTWPPGRVDQWGISLPPSARLKEAQKQVAFAQWK